MKKLKLFVKNLLSKIENKEYSFESYKEEQEEQK